MSDSTVSIVFDRGSPKWIAHLTRLPMGRVHVGLAFPEKHMDWTMSLDEARCLAGQLLEVIGSEHGREGSGTGDSP